MLPWDPLAECGRQSGPTKDTPNEGHRPKNRWAPTPKTGFQVSPYFLTLQVSLCSFLRSAVACPRSWYFQDIDYVESEVPGSSSGPPTRRCSPEARLSSTVSCPMSRRGSDGQWTLMVCSYFGTAIRISRSFSAISVLPGPFGGRWRLDFVYAAAKLPDLDDFLREPFSQETRPCSISSESR